MAINRKLLYLIILSSCIRLIIAHLLEFGNDEAYYYTYALHLQWNYFDHPPGVALLIKLSTLNFWLTDELFVRLGAVICAAAGTWLCFKIGSFIRNERTGFYAAVLYNTSIYTSIIAGIFILPDSPQVICWLAALWVLLTIFMRYEKSNNPSLFLWLLFGLLCGICVQCKVHGIFLWFGLCLYVLIYQRKMLLQPGLYLSFISMMLIISPIIIWNINNHFITYTYHSSRIAIHSFSLNLSSFIQALFGQVLYNNPINVFLIIRSVPALWAQQLFNPSITRLLVSTGLPIIIVVTAISLINAVLPHWSGPGFVTLSFIAAAYVDDIADTAFIQLPAILKSSILLIFFAIIAGISMINFYPGTIGSKDINTYGSGDFTLDMYGWANFEKQYTNWLQQQKSFTDYGNLKIVSNKWFPAAHLEYYIARPAHTGVVGIGNLNDLHNFAWLNYTRTGLKKGDNALTIIPSNYFIDAKNTYQHTFSYFTNLQTFIVKRNGKTARHFTVILLKNYQANDEVHLMVVK